MPKMKVDNTTIYYELIDNHKPETLVFSNSLGTTTGMWQNQIEAVSKHYNILLSDTRGHGRSEVSPGEYNAELLGNDILELTQSLGIDTFHFCGLSMGGLIGQWLAIHGGERLKKVILCNTAAKIGTKAGWNERIETVKRDGLEKVAAATPEKWFSDAFSASNIEEVAHIVRHFLAHTAAGYCANCAMVRDADFRNTIHQTDKNVLVVAGSKDPVTTVAHAEFLRDAIKNSTLVTIDARHLSAFEKPREFNEAILRFLR